MIGRCGKKLDRFLTDRYSSGMPVKSSLKDRAYDHIQTKFLAEKLVAGDVLSDRKLASELGMSRTPVREAIRQLETDGLVRQIPYMGTIVTTPSRAELEEMYDLRMMLEVYAAGRAAERIGSSEVNRLDSVLDRMVAIGKRIRKDPEGFAGSVGQEWANADAEFHSLLLSFAHAPRTLKIVDNMRVAMRIVGPQRMGQKETEFHRNAISHREHRQIVRALRRRDAEGASAAMVKHHNTLRQIRMGTSTPPWLVKEGGEYVRNIS